MPELRKNSSSEAQLGRKIHFGSRKKALKNPLWRQHFPDKMQHLEEY